MGKKILSLFLLFFCFGILVFFVQNNYQKMIEKNEKENQKILEKEEKKEQNTYQEQYIQRVKKEKNPTIVEEEVVQYLKNETEQADFILTQTGDLYLGFPRRESVLTKTNWEEEGYQFPSITFFEGESYAHNFLGEKIATQILLVYEGKIEDQDIIFLLTQNHTVSVLDLSQKELMIEPILNLKNVVGFSQNSYPEESVLAQMQDGSKVDLATYVE